MTWLNEISNDCILQLHILKKHCRFTQKFLMSNILLSTLYISNKEYKIVLSYNSLISLMMRYIYHNRLKCFLVFLSITPFNIRPKLEVPQETISISGLQNTIYQKHLCKIQ